MLKNREGAGARPVDNLVTELCAAADAFLCAGHEVVLNAAILDTRDPLFHREPPSPRLVCPAKTGARRYWAGAVLMIRTEAKIGRVGRKQSQRLHFRQRASSESNNRYDFRAVHRLSRENSKVRSCGIQKGKYGRGVVNPTLACSAKV